jgi:hypothetical protein
VILDILFTILSVVCHDVAEISLKLALSTINQSIYPSCLLYIGHLVFSNRFFFWHCGFRTLTPKLSDQIKVFIWHDYVFDWLLLFEYEYKLVLKSFKTVKLDRLLYFRLFCCYGCLTTYCFCNAYNITFKFIYFKCVIQQSRFKYFKRTTKLCMKMQYYRGILHMVNMKGQRPQSRIVHWFPLYIYLTIMKWHVNDFFVIFFFFIPFRAFGFLAPQDLYIICLWVYLMEVIPETGPAD